MSSNDGEELLVIEKFISLVRRTSTPDVRTQLTDETTDQLLLDSFKRLSDYDKVTVMKMAALSQPPIQTPEVPVIQEQEVREVVRDVTVGDTKLTITPDTNKKIRWAVVWICIFFAVCCIGYSFMDKRPLEYVASFFSKSK